MRESDDYENVLEELEEALEDCLEQDYKHSISSVHHAVKNLEKLGMPELIIILINSVRDFAKTNIIYADQDLTFSNTHIQEAYQKYYLALKKYEKNNYDAAIEQFKNGYLKLKEAYEELEENDNEVNFVGIDFGKIVRISYTDYDSTNPQIFLNVEIHVGWIEKLSEGEHVYYARSTTGKVWWYFDATSQASKYLCYVGVDPYTVSIENRINIVRKLERIWMIDQCHFLYAPIAQDGFAVEDRKVYAPLNDPTLELYADKYETIYIGDRKIYMICWPQPTPLPVPPPRAPDLTYQWLHPSTPSLSEGKKVVMYANLTNQGDASVSGEILSTFLLKEMLMGNETVSSLHPGEGKQIEKDYQVVAGRFVPIKTIADSKKELPEGDEKIM